MAGVPDHDVRFDLATDPGDVREILALQAANLETALDADVVAREGFVTVRHDPMVLQRMNEAAPAVVARVAGHVVAYALVMPRQFAAGVPILAPLFERLETLNWKGVALRDNPRWFVMGQICVATGHRGRGIFDGLYEMMAEAYRDRYDLTVTEVAARNTRSLRAHRRAGFETVLVYSDAATGEQWHVIALDLHRRPGMSLT